MGQSAGKVTDRLTAEEIRQYEEAFALYDSDGSGTITCDEMMELMQVIDPGLTPEDVNIMLDDMDEDASGIIEKDEFIAFMAKRASGHRKEIKLAFRIFDINDDGFITASDIEKAYNRIGCKLTARQTRRLLRVATADSEGRIHYKEFSKLMEGLLQVKPG